MLSHKRSNQFWAKVDRTGGNEACWPWLGFRHRDGHGQVKVRAIRRSPITAHRVAWLIYTGRLPQDDMVLRHTCDVPYCCNPRHLIEGTQGQNIEDRNERGRTAKGVRNGRAKLTDDCVRLIRKRQNEPIAALARKFGVTSTVIKSVLSGKTWKHVS